MGYGYYGEGEIALHPPIPTCPSTSESDPVKAALFAPDITLEGEGNTCYAIVPASSFDRKLGDPAAELQEILDTYGQGRRFDGEIVFEGEDGDTGTLSVIDGQAVLTWDEN